MGRGIIIGLDLAKQSFQVHGSGADGEVLFRKKLTRARVLAFFADQPRCTVAMEACATAPDWGREIGALGHEVKLIPPIYVKPFVKRQKNDAADAEAIAEAASRPTMRTVTVKTREQQSQSILFRTRDLLVRQRTQLINALRGHLAEYGRVASKKRVHVARLAEILEDDKCGLPQVVAETGHVYLDQIAALTERIDALQKQMRAEARRDDTARRLQTMPGIGPVTATAVTAFAPPMETFRRGRDFAASRRMRASGATLGLVPKQHSTGGQQRLGRTSKMGEPRHPQAPRHRRDVGGEGCRSPRCARWLMARQNAGKEAAHGGGHRACKSNGAPSLGHAREERRLPGPGACCLNAAGYRYVGRCEEVGEQ